MKVFHIPADSTKPLSIVDTDDTDGYVNGLRKLLDCRLLEVIYPQAGSTIHKAGSYMIIGDEEGRCVDAPAKNWRATIFAGFPYPLVGDVAVVSDLLVNPHDDDADDTIGPVPDDFHNQLLNAIGL